MNRREVFALAGSAVAAAIVPTAAIGALVASEPAVDAPAAAGGPLVGLASEWRQVWGSLDGNPSDEEPVGAIAFR